MFKTNSIGKTFYIVAAGLLIAAGPCAVAGDNTTVPTIVRVSIIDDKASIPLSLKGKYSILAYDNPERILMEGPYLWADVSATKDSLLVGARQLRTPAISVRVARDGNIYIAGRRFRGSVDIIRKENGKLLVINRLPLDEYLYGVLYHEVSHRWPMEVLKAQAITARTFALYQIRQSKSQLYDLRSDIYSQVYGGRTSEKWSTNTAVDRTRGQVLTYKGDIFSTYYHATCGGYTEDAVNLWNVDLAPLKGVECGFCSNSPHYRWTKSVPLSLLENKLRENGYKIDKVDAIAILSRNKSGRANKIEIKNSSGAVIVLTGKDFRQIFGPNDVRSAKFDFSIRGGNLVIQGMGWGHGVGMCQWGAFAQAQKGKKVDEILRFYYPGAEISTIDKIRL